MAPLSCACPRCSCVVAPDKAVIRNGLSYCCVACANGHPNHEPCHAGAGNGCSCSCGS